MFAGEGSSEFYLTNDFISFALTNPLIDYLQHLILLRSMDAILMKDWIFSARYVNRVLVLAQLMKWIDFSKDSIYVILIPVYQ